jgi:uncharacterized membrane protein
MKPNNLFTQWRGNFFTGLAIVTPAVISVGVLVWLFGTISNITDKLFVFLPSNWTHGDILPGDGRGPMYWYWSLLALLIAVFLIGLIGRFARNYLGRKAIEWIDQVMMRIPLLNKVYGTIKQVNEAFSSNKSSFKQVVLVQFPTPTTNSIGFVTGEQRALSPTGEKLISVFIPTTPNPTSGFLILVPENSLTKLDMSVADGIKFIISLGSISPELISAQTAALKPERPLLSATP